MIRTGVAASVVAAVGCTRMAGSDQLPLIEFVVVGLALICAARPDSHLGLVVVIAIGVSWVATVDSSTTPWSIGVAISIAVFHLTMAAASVAPVAAAWSPAMARRWITRLLVVAAAIVPTWAISAAIQQVELGRKPALVTLALLGIALAAMWIRHGNLDLDRPS